MPDNATIDRWIAERVMGWTLRPDYGELWCIGNEPQRRCDQWSPTTNISDAMESVDEILKNPDVLSFHLVSNRTGHYACISFLGDRETLCSVTYKDRARAIAALVVEYSGGQP